MKKGLALIIVFLILIVVFLLISAILNLMNQEANITESKIKRTRRLLAAQAGIVHAYERLGRGDSTASVDDTTIHIGDQNIPVKIIVLDPGNSRTVDGNTIECPVNAPSDHCIHAYVDY
jgi:Tfp pilus assembly protein PilX